MSMSVGGESDEVISTINTTPLVDVMLVMLIIFLITIPVIVPTVIAMAAYLAAATGRLTAELPLISTMCRSALKARRCSSATLLRRTSQL